MRIKASLLLPAVLGGGCVRELFTVVQAAKHCRMLGGRTKEGCCRYGVVERGHGGGAGGRVGFHSRAY